MILLSYVYGKGGKVTDHRCVVDEDRSEMSSKAIQMFDDNKSPYYTVTKK
jgi:ABC-2 type transport system permease protein